eukprot:COSAG02_NODE_62123_length_266_cov_1.874251_1_plen_75_part_01
MDESSRPSRITLSLYRQPRTNVAATRAAARGDGRGAGEYNYTLYYIGYPGIHLQVDSHQYKINLCPLVQPAYWKD